MIRKSMLVAATLSVLSVTFAGPTTPAVQTAPSESAQRQGYTIYHLTHGQWVSQTFYNRQDAIEALNYYHSYGIPAYMR